MEKQYLPIVVFRSGVHGYAKAYSSHAKRIGDKFCWTLEEAKQCIKEVTDTRNNKKPTTIACDGFGITSKHCDENEVVDSYIKVREVTEWKVIK